VVYITTPVIPSCFMAFFSDPYSPFENFNFYYTSLFPIQSSDSFIQYDSTV